MRWLEAARTRVKLLISGRSAERRMEEEFAFHIDMETERLMREGIARGDARRRALIAFGGAEQYREELREGRGLAWLSGMSLDLKLGLRMMVRYPGLTCVAVLALAVAIGAGAAYMEFVNDMFRPRLGFAGGDRVVGIYHQDLSSGQPRDASVADFLEWRASLRSMEHIGAYRSFERNLITADGRAEPAKGVAISASAFDIMPVRPLLGRGLSESDERAGAQDVVVLGETLWRARFGGDAAVIGRAVQLGTARHTIVGVMPEAFGFPVNHGMWVPLRLPVTAAAASAGSVKVFGRRHANASLEAAAAELSRASIRAASERASTNQHLRARVKPYVASIWAGQVDGVLQMRILYSVNLFFFALLCVCGANVATLVFARTATREGEITVRNALGASRMRITTQIFAEALVLTMAAAAAGLGAAYLALRWGRTTIASMGGVTPFWWSDGFAPSTLAYAILLTLFAAFLIGVVPALKATGPKMQARLKHAAAGGSTMQFKGVWTGVIIGQVALTVIFLLVVASIAYNVRVGRYGTLTPAFPADEYLSVRVEGLGATSFETLERRLLSEPGVRSVAYTDALPGTTHPWAAIEIEGGIKSVDGETVHSLRKAAVASNYLATFGAKLIAGRMPDASDAALDRDVVVVDRTFAEKVIGGRSAIGMRIREVPEDESEAAGDWHEIVGVVSELSTSPDKAPGDAVMYRASLPTASGSTFVVVHVNGSPRDLALRLRAIAAGVDPTLRLYAVLPLDELGKSGKVAMRLVVTGLAVVGVIALLLATAGVYSLLSFTVTQRRREIGVRAAMGASPRRLLISIFRPVIIRVMIGIAVGSIPGSMIVAHGLPEVARGAGWSNGAAAFAAISAFMLCVALVACIVPASRALRIQPKEALQARA